MLLDAVLSITDINTLLQLSKRLLEQSNETALVANMLWSLDALSSSEICLELIDRSVLNVSLDALDFGLATKLVLRRAVQAHDPGGVYTCYRSGIERGLGQDTDYHALEDALEAFGAWLPLAELLEMRSAAFGAKARDCLIRATDIYLEKSPQRKGLVRVLEARLALGDSAPWLLDRLSVELEEDGQWSRLRDVLDAHGSTPEHLLRVIRLERLLGEPSNERLRSLYERIWRLGASCKTYYAPLRRLYRILGDDEALETLSTYVASEASDAELRVAANMDRGIMATDSGRDATEIWRSVLAIDTHNLVAIERIAASLRLRGDMYGLISLYREHAPLGADGIRLLREAVDVARREDVEKTLRLELLERLNVLLLDHQGQGLSGAQLLEYAELLFELGRVVASVDALLLQTDGDSEFWAHRRARRAAEILVSSPEYFDDALAKLVELWTSQPTRAMLQVFEKALKIHLEQQLLDALVCPEVVSACDKEVLHALIRFVCGALREAYGDDVRYRILDDYRCRYDQQDPEVLEQLLELQEDHDEAWQVLAETLYPIRPRFELAVNLADYHSGRDELALCATWFRKALVLRPDDVHVMRKLLEVEFEREQWRSVLRLLDALSTRAGSVNESVSYLDRQLSLYAERLGEPMKAEAVARRILREAPTAEKAFLFLTARARETEDWSGLCTLIEQRLLHGEDVALRMELAHLNESQGQRELSLKHFRTVLRLRPNDLVALEKCYALSTDDHERRRLRSALMSLDSDSEALIKYLVDEAENAESSGQVLGGLKQWRRVLEIEPEHQIALVRIETVLRTLGDSRGLASFLCDQERFSEAAEVYAQIPGGFVERVNCLEMALKQKPDDQRVFDSLEAIYTESGSWQKLVDLLKARLGVANESQLVETLQVRIARLESTQLGEPKQAFQEVLEAFEEKPSQRLLTQLFELAIPIGEAKTVYTVAYEQLVQFEYFDLLLRLAHELLSMGVVEGAARCFLAGVEGGVDSERTIECFDVLALSKPCMEQLAELGRSHGSSDEAQAFAFLAQLSAPEDTVLLEVDLSGLPVSLLRDGVRRLEHTGHLLAYRAWLDALWSVTKERSVLRRLIELVAGEFADVSAATSLLAYFEDPILPEDCEVAMRLVARETEQALDVFERFAAIEHLDDLSTFALVNLARVLVSTDEPSALKALRMAFEKEQNEPVPNSLFARIPLSLLRVVLDEYPAGEVQASLVSPLLSAMSSHEGSDAGDWPNLWTLFESTHGRYERTFDLIDWLLSRDLFGEFFERSATLLEGASEDELANVVTMLTRFVEASRTAVIEVLTGMFETYRCFDAGRLLWDILPPGHDRRQVGETLLKDPKTDPELSAHIFLSQADDSQLASDQIKYLEAAVRLLPQPDEAFARLVELHVELGHRDRIGRLFDERLERDSTLASDGRFYRFKADASARVGNLLAAERALRSAVDLGDGFVDRCALGDVLWQQRNLKDYVALEIRTLRLDGDRRARFEVTLGRLTDANDSQVLFRFLVHSLQEVVPHETGVRLLLSSMEDTARYWEGVKALQSLASRVTGSERVGLLMTAGGIYGDRLNRLDAGVECYRRALEENPGHEDARVELVKLLGRQGLHAEMVAESSNLSELAQVAVGRPLIEAFRLLELHDEAQRLLAACAAENPGATWFFEGLFRGFRRVGQHEEAVSAAERFLKAGGDVEVPLIRELAALCLSELGSEVQALSWLKRVPLSRRTIEDRLLEIECYFAPAHRDVLSDWLDDRAGMASDDGVALILCKRIADGFGRGEFHGQQALDWLENLVEELPKSLEALSLVLNVAESAQAHDTVSRTLLKLLRLPIGRERETEVLIQLGQLHAKVLNTPEQAIGFLERALKHEPTHLPTRLALAEIYLKRDFAKRSLKLLSEIQHLPMSEPSQEQHYLEMVLSCGSSLKSSQLDWAAERMLALQPDHLPALELLANRAAQEADWARAEGLILELLAHHRAVLSKEDLSKWLYVLGTVNEYLRGYAVASHLYHEAVSVDGQNQRAQRALERDETHLSRESPESDSPVLSTLLEMAEAKEPDSE
ncbi:MAG: tetratricopeptide repeat protein [Bradymonadia bacterium]